ncbi:glutaminyl-peptide cyclotransferase-like [Anneissia japonica]|uniref:glutaminyl-peptide cyclotransferase-like n=1 Tax=Anneissia japonica TaxID=1529436 RepID=UPI00142580B6|nr:glutaminyl-peptide cyclotransferase-like [Anneissia japonica]
MQLFKAILLAYVFYFRKDSSKDKSVPVNNNVGPTTNTNEDGAITNNWVLNQEIHRPKNLSNSRLKRVADMANLTELKAILTPILVPRVAGTPGNEAVRNHIIGRLQSLPGWHIESHSFTDTAPHPFRETNFTNIIATHNINAPRRLVLACHHDSKYMEPDTTGKMFVGATDSAVPCAMLIHLAENLHSYIASKSLDFSVSFVFTSGVKILHLIPVPFPNHWHKLTDDESNLHYPTIMNLQKIVQAFVAEYMRLDV